MSTPEILHQDRVLKQRLVFSTHAGDIVLDYRKAAFLPETETLLVADLHFEKASYLQVKGHAPVPAYDTPDTVERLKSLIALYRPKRIAALGDSFHDIAAGERLSPQSYETINAIIDSVESFIWILGNHDPDIPKGLKGAQEDHVQEGRFLLTHLPIEAEGGLNICGHLHPTVKIKTGRRNFWKACFACSEKRIILPSFGTFTGGLDVGHEAITEVLGEKPCYFAISSDGLIGIS